MDLLHRYCADPSVGVSESAPDETKRLWMLHGHPHSQRYVNPESRSLTALVEYNATMFPSTTAFVYPESRETTSYVPITWERFHEITNVLAVRYSRELREEITDAMQHQKQPTVALLGRGNTFEYFATQIALIKLNLRVLLLADGNPASIIQGLLFQCSALTIVVDAKQARLDFSEVRKVAMLEGFLDYKDHLENPTDNVLKNLRFEDGTDPWERHVFTLHSSGSTGLPKHIVHTNRSLILGARTYRLFSEFHIDNWFLLFPLYHIAGLYVILGGLPNGQTTSFGPRDWPPTASSILDAWEVLKPLGYPVDCAHSPPTIIENLHEYLTRNGNDFTALASLKILQPGGAKLSDSIVNSLVLHGVNVKSTYGSTEIGAVMRTIPHTKANPYCYEGFRIIYPDSEKIEMLDVGDNFFEMIVHKGFELAAELWLGKVDDEPYRTNDLFLQDPPGSGSFNLIGRRDDLLILSDGNNVSAGKLQLDVQAGNPMINNVLAVGHTRPCVSLLVELKNDEDRADHELRDTVWKGVDKVNKDNPRHYHVLRSMIYVLPKGESLPITPKGNVKRNEALKVFAGAIEELYSNLKGDHSVKTARANKEVQSSQIHDLVSTVSGIPPSELNSSVSFYDIGMDSIAALHLQTLLTENIKYISLGAIFENPSVDRLAAYISSEGNPRDSDKSLSFIKTVLDKYSDEFVSWPQSTGELALSEAGQIILLTGASGSLGTALLERLVNTPNVKKIFALIRGSNTKILEESLNRRRMRADEILGRDRVEVLNKYNMTDPLLGLDVDSYKKLSLEVTTVIHNAWKVDFNLSVEDFEHEYLRGTMSLLRFCHVGRPKLFNYTSSVSASLGAAADREISETPIGGDPGVALQTGYAQSKYIVERITQIASVQLTIRCKIFRIGQLTGHSKLGYWSENDMYPIMFATSKQMDAIPTFSGRVVDWLPVDVAAGVITDLVLDPPHQDISESYTVHNIVNPRRIQWSALLSIVQDAISSAGGKPLEQISIQEWTRRLSDQDSTNSELIKHLPALRLLSFFEGMLSEEEEKPRLFNTKKTERLSKTLRASAPINRELMELYMRRWEESGFWR